MSTEINAELLDLCQGMADLIDRCGLAVNADFDTALRAALAKAEAAEPDPVEAMQMPERKLWQVTITETCTYEYLTDAETKEEAELIAIEEQIKGNEAVNFIAVTDRQASAEVEA